LADATDAERAILGSIRTQRNLALLHTDASLLPRCRKAWAAWNFEAGANEAEHSVCLHYLINRLQPLPWSTPVIVSLNPLRPPRDDLIVDVHEFDHPVFDAAALDAQRRVATIQGRSGVWFCGAWAGHGFHEDGLQAGLDVGRQVRAAFTASERSGVERVAA
jgi:predicted NAD/FAD-binding protein